MLHGFEISHFRNFGSTPSLVGPLGKVNIFIGSNNSGKSNILRYIRDFLVPVNNVKRGAPSSLTAINRSMFAQDEPKAYTLLVPLEQELLEQLFQLSRPYQKEKMSAFFHSHYLCINGSHIRIPMRVDKTNGSNAVIVEGQLEQEQSEAIQIIANSASIARGNAQESLGNILHRIYENYYSEFDTKYVPAFRQIKTKLPEFKHEYEEYSSGPHIADQIIRYSNPTYENQSHKKSFEKLENFLRDITQIDDLKIEIPHDFSTINVLANGVFRPLEALGSGVHDLFILAAEIVLNEGKLILLEEPETHMHPEFQRKLMRFLSEEIDAQFFITTHSPVIIDTPEAKVFGVSTLDRQAMVKPLLTSQTRRNACRELGYRASDLLQSNCIIWVEGPSDRVYLNHWIRQADAKLCEGIHYRIMFYGGRLLSHLSLEDEQVGDFIQLLPINRAAAVVIDSDLGSRTQSLRETKVRIIDEVREIGGIAWVTAGREIENYIPAAARERAIRAVHKNFNRLSGAKTRYGKPLEYLRLDGKIQSDKFDKLAIAKKAVEEDLSLDVMDLQQKILELVDFIWDQN